MSTNSYLEIAFIIFFSQEINFLVYHKSTKLLTLLELNPYPINSVSCLLSSLSFFNLVYHKSTKLLTLLELNPYPINSVSCLLSPVSFFNTK